MPKRRQIPFLHARQLADGSKSWHWCPSKTVKALGWPAVSLGTDEASAVKQALDINARLAAWRAGNGAAPAAASAANPPRLVRWDGLLARYRRSRDYQDLKRSSQNEYDSRLRWLTSWALDGPLIVRQIDHGMVQDLKRALQQSGSSDHRTAAMLRVLRLVLSFAEREGIIPHGSNPAHRAKIREPRARRHILSLEAVQALAAWAEGQGRPNLALAIQLGFWTLQRQGDLLGRFNRLAWRAVDDVESRDAALLAGTGGRVMAFRLQQGKTGTWVDAPVPPFLHDAIDAAFRLPPLPGDALLRDDTATATGTATATPLADWRLQRQWREACTACAAQAAQAGRVMLEQELATAQFRDLRRSGMVYMRDAGAKKEWITSLSGHTILAKKSIMDTYMPGDTAAACAAVAQALRLLGRQSKEKLA